MGATGQIGILAAVFPLADKRFVDTPISECAEEWVQSESHLWSAGIFPSTVKKITGVFGVRKEELKTFEEEAGLAIAASPAAKGDIE